MLRERANVIVWGHRTLDIALTILAYLLAYIIKKYGLPDEYRGLIKVVDYRFIGILVVICWYLSFNFCDLYASYRDKMLSQILWRMVKAVFLGLLILSLALYVFKINMSRLMIGIFVVLDIVFLSISKGTVYWALRRFREKGFNFKNVLIVGSRDRAKEVIDSVLDRPGAGFRIFGCVDADEKLVGKEVKRGVRIVGTTESLEEILRSNVIDEIVFAMPLEKLPEAANCMLTAEELGRKVRIIPQWHIKTIDYAPRIGSLHFEEFLEMPTLTISTTPVESGAIFLKNVFDYVMASLLLVLLSPVLLLISIAIKVTSKGPVLFRQERSGLNGRKFILYKFRTMKADAEQMRETLSDLNEADGPVFKIRKDPRVIPVVGTFLRKTGLDEIPQFFNVLKGEMSLVGPRPPIPAEVDVYDVWQRRRLSMKPGLTCLWQSLPNRNNVGFNDWMSLDLQYIDNWSLKLDFKILMRTILAVLTCAGR